MATTKSGVITHKICNDLITFTIEWSAEQDFVYKTTTYKVALYMDTSACKYFKTDTAGSTDSSSLLYLYDSAGKLVDYFGSFKMPQYGLTSNVGKVLIFSGEVSDVSIGDEAFTMRIAARIHPRAQLRAYTSLLSYTASSANIEFGADITLDGCGISAVKTISGDLILAQEHTLSVNRQNSNYTHSIEYICGKEKVAICDKSTALSFKFTPAEALAAQNTEGTKVKLTFYLRTYYGDHLMGTETAEHEFTIPNTVKPSCTIEVTDGEFKNGDYLSAYYGGFVQGHSRFHIKVIPTPAYGSPIEEYEVEVDGVPYTLTDDEMDTPIITASGAHSIKARVKDARGRTSETYSTTASVLPYAAPVVTDLTATRCNLDGTENPKGGCMKVVFSAKVTPLSNKNSATYVITHSKTSGLDHFEGVLGDHTGRYTVTNGEYIFEAEIDSTYVIQVQAKDDFEEHTRTVGGGLVTILMNWLASGRGMCFGGIATLEDTVECQFKFYPSGGVLIPPFTANNLFIRDPGTYYVENPADIINCPVDDPFIFEIMPVSDDGLDILQRITTCPQGEAPRVLVRTLVSSSWGQFYDMTTGQSI